jgi:PPOX class probable F420-dependent enzyme
VTTLAAPVETVVPASHRDLFERPVIGVLTTLLPGGQPQSSLVWVDLDDGIPRTNTTLERQKGRNLQADARATLLVVDPDDTSRFVSVRGDAELARDGAEDHLDRLTRRYTRHPAFYGHVVPAAQRALDTRVIVRIHPRHVTLDAIHR